MRTVHYISTVVVAKTGVVAGMQNCLSVWHFSIKYIKNGGSFNPHTKWGRYLYPFVYMRCEKLPAVNVCDILSLRLQTLRNSLGVTGSHSIRWQTTFTGAIWGKPTLLSLVGHLTQPFLLCRTGYHNQLSNTQIFGKFLFNFVSFKMVTTGMATRAHWQYKSNL